MTLSNIYKPEANKFSHLGSEEDDDSDDLDDEIDDGYGTALLSPTRNVQKQLMPPNRTTKIRRAHSKPWCTTRACFVFFLWLAFFSICITGLVLLILQAIESKSKDSDVHFVKKVLTDKQDGFLNDENNFAPCDELEATKVWHATMPKLMTETAVRLNDVNEDGVDDLMVGFSTGVDGYNAPKISCDLYFNGTYPCYGGLMALDGKTGKQLWRHYTMHEIYSVNCNGDLDMDGVRDCLISGRAGVFQAISGKRGELIWNFGPQESRDTNMNLYTAQFIRDLNGDGVMEVLVTHGGDPLAEPNSPERLVGRLLIFSGKTGEVLRWVRTPDERETYFSPVIYTKKDSTELVLFGTGGETHPGGLYVVPLIDLFHGLIENSKLIYKDDYKGVMNPPVLVDLNNDGTVDITMAMYNTTVIAFDGENYKRLWHFVFPSSESYTSPAAGFFNKDSTADFLVRYNYGSGFPVYFYSNVTVIDGKTGKPLVTPFMKSSSMCNTSPLTASMQGLGNDLFIYWVSDCLGHEGEGGNFEFVEGTNVHEQSRADTCKLRYNAKSFSKLRVTNHNIGFPGKDIYYSEDFQDIEHESLREETGSKPNSKNSTFTSRRKRHIGAPDHGGYQRLISTGSMATSLGEENNKEPMDSIDVVFTTYWQYPAKVRIILPEDKACIENYRNLSRAGKFDNDVDEDKNEKLGIYDAGDSAVNECLKKKQHQTDKEQIFVSQSDYDLYKVHFGSLTVYRFSLKCKCNNLSPSKKCAKFLPMSEQGWGGYMGTLTNSFFNPRKRP